MPVCRSLTCWASRSPPAPHEHKQPTRKVHVFARLFYRVFSGYNNPLMCLICALFLDVEASTGENEMERWARERRERRQARARRKAQRTGEVNTGSVCLTDG